MKAWYHPTTGRAHVFHASKSHGREVGENRDYFGVPDAITSTYLCNTFALDQGWVRCRNIDGAQGYSVASPNIAGAIQGITPMLVRKTLIWMRDNKYLPNRVTVEIGYTSHAKFFDLCDHEIDDYISRGCMKAFA